MNSIIKSFRKRSKPLSPSNLIRKFEPYTLFTKEIISSPRTVGAVCPSSPFLATSMAQEVNINDDGFVIELGGGTGNITKALLAHGVPPRKLITIERSPELAAYLSQKFPGIQVIKGDAGQLVTLLGDCTRNINAIVSGLPFKSLPDDIVSAIKQQIQTLLQEGGKFIQFTYDLTLSELSFGSGFSVINSKIEWRNLPPARISTMVCCST